MGEHKALAPHCIKEGRAIYKLLKPPCIGPNSSFPAFQWIYIPDGFEYRSYVGFTLTVTGDILAFASQFDGFQPHGIDIRIVTHLTIVDIYLCVGVVSRL